MVAPWKKKEVDLLARKMGEANVVGLVGVSNIPSKQSQQIRANLRSDIEIRVTRNNVIKHALKKADLGELDEHVNGPIGVIFTKLNPFKLEKKIFENRTQAPAKAGQEAPEDIVIPKGDTPFAPGPIIGDLQKVGIKAKIQGGKIIVTDDSLVVKQGGAISRDLANVLARLDIKPMTIGLTLLAAYEDGMVYPGGILHVDEAETTAKIRQAHARAINLAYNTGITNKGTITHFIAKASADARNLAINAEIVNAETIKFFLSKASAQMNALKSILPAEVLVEAPAEAKEDGKGESGGENPAEETKTETDGKKKEDNAGETPAEQQAGGENKRESTEATGKEAEPAEKKKD